MRMFPMNTPFILRQVTKGSIVAVLVACSVDPTLSSKDAEPSGKADGIQEATEVRCDFDIETPLPSTSRDLEPLVVAHEALERDRVDDAQASQILAAARLLGFVGSDASLSDVYELVDDPTIDWMEVEFEAENSTLTANWIRFFVGDTEVGVVFEGGTLNPLGEVGDGDIKGCTAETNPAPSTCGFDVPTELPSTSEHLAEFIVSGEPLGPGDVDEGQAAQVLAAARHLGFIGPEASVDDAFAAADEGIVEWIQLEIDQGEAFIAADWIRFFAGDTEVGVIFEASTTTPLGEVGDGDVAGCVPEPKLTCDFEGPTELPQTSEQLAQFIVFGRELELGQADEAQATQILAAGRHLGFVGPEGTLVDVFETADDGLVEWIQLEIDEGESFIAAEWVRFFVGDTEVGVVFEPSSTTPIGEIGDGDIAGCTIQ